MAATEWRGKGMGKQCGRFRALRMSVRESTTRIAVAIDEQAIEEEPFEKPTTLRARRAEPRCGQSAFRCILSGPWIIRVIRVGKLENVLFRSLADARQPGKAQFRRESRVCCRVFTAR
jgi:hypothetical protein